MIELSNEHRTQLKKFISNSDELIDSGNLDELLPSLGMAILFSMDGEKASADTIELIKIYDSLNASGTNKP